MDTKCFNDVNKWQPGLKSEDNVQVPYTRIFSSGQQGDSSGCKNKFDFIGVYDKMTLLLT